MPTDEQIEQWAKAAGFCVSRNRIFSPYMEGANLSGLVRGVTELAQEADRNRIEELQKALTRVLRYFPTDDDMHAASWEQSWLDEACNAYEEARKVLLSQGENE